MVNGNGDSGRPRGKPGEKDGDEDFVFPGEPESREEVRSKILGEPPVGRTHPPSVPKPSVGRGGQIADELRAIEDNTSLLQVIASRVNDLQSLLVTIGQRIDLSYHDDYLFSTGSVSSGNAKDIDVSSRLGRLGRRGWVKKETADGTLEVELNGGKAIELKGRETLDLDFLQLESITFSTGADESISWRLLEW